MSLTTIRFGLLSILVSGVALGGCTTADRGPTDPSAAQAGAAPASTTARSDSVLANCPAQEGEDLRARAMRCTAEKKKRDQQ